ncbi:MAG: hypothetical protein HFF17_03865 [Oscillospiraceae bacterium]|nr:hypothetical protein [Oscillospiraceae bacterium]
MWFHLLGIELERHPACAAAGWIVVHEGADQAAGVVGPDAAPQDRAVQAV